LSLFTQGKQRQRRLPGIVRQEYLKFNPSTIKQSLMKTFKSLIVAVLIFALSSIAFLACQKQDMVPAQEKSVDQALDARARMAALLELGRKQSSTPQQLAQYVETMNSLSFDESQLFLQVLYEKGIADAKAKKDVELIAEIERLHTFKLAMNTESMDRYGKPFFGLNDTELQAVIEQTYSRLKGNMAGNGRTAAVIPALSCAFAGGSIVSSASYTTVSRSPLLFTNWQWADNDRNVLTPCDCQFAYPTTDLAYNKVSGTSDAARAELQRRGSLIRRRITSGVSTGTYLLNGTSGLNAFSSCADFGNQIRLSK
jgi:hypothetical protein